MFTRTNVLMSILIIVLAISTTYLIFENINKSQFLEKNSFSQVAVDEKFILYLSIAQGDFGVDFLKMTDQKEREAKFSNSIVDLSAAVALSEHTSYDVVNKDLDIALYGLLRAMQDKDDKAMQVMKDSNSLYNILKDIVFFPKDQGKTKVLSDYIINMNLRH